MHPSDVAMPMDYSEFNKAVMKSRVQTGSATEFLVAYNLTEQGFTISLPVTVSPKYDLIAERDGLMLRVQVKTMGRTKGKINIPTGSYRYYSKRYISGAKLKRQYSRGDFDVLAALDRDTSTVYYVPERLMDYSVAKMSPTQQELEQFSSIDWVLDNLVKS